MDQIGIIGHNRPQHQVPSPREPWSAESATQALQSVNSALSRLDMTLHTLESVQRRLPDPRILAPYSQHWPLITEHRASSAALTKARQIMERFQRNLQKERDIEVTRARKR